MRSRNDVRSILIVRPKSRVHFMTEMYWIGSLLRYMPESLRVLTFEPVFGASGTTRQCPYEIGAIYLMNG